MNVLKILRFWTCRTSASASQVLHKELGEEMLVYPPVKLEGVLDAVNKPSIDIAER